MAKRQRISETDREKTYFESQREALISDIAMVSHPLQVVFWVARPRLTEQSFEHVLGNINKLNRSLEEVIKMGNDFSSVEALWSQFENVMAKEEEPKHGQQAQAEGSQQAESEDHERHV
ncbi:hypothetical protein EsDP_00004309 [Epichloe bromicola]|uniref:DASH complex subunit DAD1 n=1 Tax=Epichloe bromicola TaxID=79588 RepID=A0ABQ0CRB7_9HYPO